MNAKKYLTVIVVCCIAIVLAGCATIISGTKQKVPVTSVPEGASIIVNGTDSGTTPATLKLKRNDTYDIVLKKDGFKDISFTLDKSFAAFPVLGNIVTFGLIGFLVDFADGSCYRLTPKELSATLEKTQMSLNLSGDKDSINVIFLSAADLESPAQNIAP